jgi:hypothetical protein
MHPIYEQLPRTSSIARRTTKRLWEDGTWRHVRVLLKPVNRDFQPIELTCEDEGSVDVVAEMLEVLG